MNERKNALIQQLEICIANSQAVSQSIVEQHIGSIEPESRQINRVWGLNSAAALVHVSRQSIITAEKEGRLPPPSTINGRRSGYTIYEIEKMRQIFDRRPWLFDEVKNDFNTRPYDCELDCVTVSICGHKGGSYKTTVSVHFAQWLAMQGYRVLLIDLDPQASATRYMGLIPDYHVSENDTLLPFMSGNADDLGYAVRETHWPNLSIIPSCLAMQKLEKSMDHAEENDELSVPKHLMLRAGIQSIDENFDVVIVDGSPNLAAGTLNQVFAGDVVICPTPAELNDYASTEQFFSAILGMINDLDDAESLDFLPVLRVLLTKYSYLPGSSSQLMAEEIRRAWGGLVLQNKIKITDEIGKGQYRSRSIYEQSTNERSSISSWRNADAIFSPLFVEILTTLVQPFWIAAE